MDHTDSYRREVTAKVESGWRIEDETPDRITLVRREFGDLGVHVIIAVLTLWWTMGLGNVLYAVYKYFTESQRTIVWKRPADISEGVDEVAPNVE